MKRKVKDAGCSGDETRDRIVSAAFEAFLERGYAKASTLDIATRAKVSKRELYSHFQSKKDLFANGIAERTERMRFPLALPDVTTEAALAATLKSFGVALLSGVTDDHVLAIYRLAIAESRDTPEIARTLDDRGRGSVRRTLTAFLKTALKNGLVRDADPGEMTYFFSALLLSDTQLRLILGVARRPAAKEIERRAQYAADAFMKLYARSPLP